MYSNTILWFVAVASYVWTATSFAKDLFSKNFAMKILHQTEHNILDAVILKTRRERDVYQIPCGNCGYRQSKLDFKIVRQLGCPEDKDHSKGQIVLLKIRRWEISCDL